VLPQTAKVPLTFDPQTAEVANESCCPTRRSCHSWG
jgi:hypothetical protein